VKKLIFILVLGLAACNGTATPATPVPSVETATPSVVPAPTNEPTSTPIPLAATVNGQPITLAAYEAEVARYEAAAASLGQDLTQNPDYRAKVLDALIEKAMVLQAAQALGLAVADADVQTAYDQVVAQRGGQAEFDSWLQANLYTPDQFRAELQAGLLANAVQSQVAAGVPADVEQVHARQILVATREEADTIETELAAGADFATEAVNNSLDPSRINGGDLGWFPVSGLTQPEVAQAAFALSPNEISQPVQSALGFHIIQLLERGVRPLSSTALALLQKQAVDAWRADLRSKAQIEKFVP
jgi:parvulin-like peptidyl-prolyl isomerase